MFNQGQVCCAGSRVFIHKDQYDEVVDEMASYVESLRQGAGLHKDTQIGPLVSKEQHERVLSYIQKGKDEGAKAVTGGSCPFEAGYFVAPTVFANVEDEMTIAKEEIFDPC